MSRPYYKNPSSRPPSSQTGGGDGPVKIAAAACYLPSLIGFVVGIIYIFCKGPGCNGNFFRFHFYQSIFLGILGTCVMMLANGSTGIVVGFARLFEGVLGAGFVGALMENSAITGLILASPLFLAAVYGAIWALLGKFTTLPWVSKVIWNMLR